MDEVEGNEKNEEETAEADKARKDERPRTKKLERQIIQISQF
jgi:hypothetical protein